MPIRSSFSDGWRLDITRAAEPQIDRYGYIYDNVNTFSVQSSYPAQPVAVQFTSESEAITILEGDYLTLTYDDGQTVNVYPPALSGDINTYYYVGWDGSTYNDRWLCALAKAATTPTPSATPTPSVTPTTSVTPTLSPSITPRPTATAYETPPPSPPPTATNTPRHRLLPRQLHPRRPFLRHLDEPGGITTETGPRMWQSTDLHPVSGRYAP